MTDVYTGCVSRLMNAWAIVRHVLGNVRPVTSLQNVKSSTIQRFLDVFVTVGLEVNPDKIVRDDKNAWIGTAAAFWDFLEGFGLWQKEMRTGVSQVTFGYHKTNNEQDKRPKIVELVDYGWMAYGASPTVRDGDLPTREARKYGSHSGTAHSSV